MIMARAFLKIIVIPAIVLTSMFKCILIFLVSITSGFLILASHLLFLMAFAFLAFGIINGDGVLGILILALCVFMIPIAGQKIVIAVDGIQERMKDFLL